VSFMVAKKQQLQVAYRLFLCR